MSAIITEPSAVAPAAPSERRTRLAERLIPAFAVFAALATGVARPANTDISWLLTVNERILAGATPYKDIVELNPPASILLYRIPVVVAHWLSIRAEIAVIAFLALLIGAALAYARWALARCEVGDANRIVFLVVAALILSVLPFDEMAQREHFATVLALPYALAAIVRATGKKPSLVESALAGLAMGLCVAIKPHFAFGALFVSGWAALRSRSLAAFVRTENLAALAVALGYLAASFAFFPYFFADVLPMVRDLYLPIRLGAGELIAHIAPPLILPLFLCWAFRDQQRSAGAQVLLLMAAGFLAAYFLQGKGWIYHAYPVLSFGFFAAAWALPIGTKEAGRVSPKLGVALLAAAMIIPAPSFFRRDEQHAALAAAVAKLRPHPKLLALSFRQSLGHPLARNIGAVWIGRSWGLWPTGLAVLMRERAGDDAAQRAKADGYFERDRLATTEDIEAQRPDVLLIEETPGFDFNAWIAGSPRLAAALERYRLVGTVDGVEILQRQDARQS